MKMTSWLPALWPRFPQELLDQHDRERRGLAERHLSQLQRSWDHGVMLPLLGEPSSRHHAPAVSEAQREQQQTAQQPT